MANIPSSIYSFDWSPEQQRAFEAKNGSAVVLWERAGQFNNNMTPGFHRYIHDTTVWTDASLWEKFRSGPWEMELQEKRDSKKGSSTDDKLLPLARLLFLNRPVVERLTLERSQILEEFRRQHGEEASVSLYNGPREFTLSQLAAPEELGVRSIDVEEVSFTTM